MQAIVLLFIGFFSIAIVGQNIAYDPDNSKGKLYEYAQFSGTAKGITDIQDVISGTHDLDFKNLTSENQSLGFTSDHYWATFSLQNTSETSKTYYLQTARPVTDIANLYQINNEQVLVMHSGDGIPFTTRQVAHRETIFKVQLPKNSTQLFYLHLKSDGETLNLPLTLYSENTFWKSNYDQQLFLGVFYGLLFLAGLIYLFFFTSLSNNTFLYYSLYVFSIAMLQSALDGFIFQYVLPSGGYFNDRAVLITALLSNFFLLKYCEYFLKVGERTIRLKYGFKIAYIVIFILGILLFISDSTKAFVYPISNINGLLSLILILVTLFYLRYKKIAVDFFFSIGIFFLVIGLLGFVLNNLSLLPNNFFVLNSAKFGIGFEVVFLSLSMTNLIRDMRLEKEKSQIVALAKSEEISDIKSYFMSNMSHELRTPINTIMGIADDELTKNPDNQNQKNFEMIKHASMSLLSNINDILDFENLEKGELKLRTESFELKRSIELINNNWQHLAEKKGLKYNLILDKNLPFSVEGDSERFAQIINNVLSNAVKFTAAGNVEFTVRYRIQNTGHVHITMTISDTGVGIKKEEKLHVFNSFGQMRLNNKRRFGGVGLGLSIVKHLIELFEGTINIESEEGQGTKVSMSLALKILENKPPKIAVKTKDDQSINLLKVLVVEDNLMNQMIMKKILTTLNITDCKMVFNGQEALDVMKTKKFNVILMDLQMPIMDGYEATTTIRTMNLEGVDKDIPIIAVTGDATDSARQKVREVGMNDYITKPVNRELLFDKIIKHTKVT